MILALVLLLAGSAAGDEVGQVLSGVPSPASVLWIGVHPDDEMLASPLLSRWCGGQRAKCTILTLTRGEQGACSLPGGCSPDVATVRSAEQGAASQYFGADQILLSFKEGGRLQRPSWHPDGPGATRVVSTLAAYINAVTPEVILTFDPRHGTTCHPDHRALGSLVLEASTRTDSAASIYLLETRTVMEADTFVIHFPSAIDNSLVFDANEELPERNAPAWKALADEMAIHASQFEPRWIDAVLAVPESGRMSFFAPAADALSQTVRYSCD